MRRFDGPAVSVSSSMIRRPWVVKDRSGHPASDAGPTTFDVGLGCLSLRLAGLRKSVAPLEPLLGLPPFRPLLARRERRGAAPRLPRSTRPSLVAGSAAADAVFGQPWRVQSATMAAVVAATPWCRRRSPPRGDPTGGVPPIAAARRPTWSAVGTTSWWVVPTTPSTRRGCGTSGWHR